MTILVHSLTISGPSTGSDRLKTRYFSPRLLCRFVLPVRAISIGRRIASEREGLSFCCLAHALVPVLGREREENSWFMLDAHRPVRRPSSQHYFCTGKSRVSGSWPC